ncbi:sulfotransferase [Thalassococcus sp. S3]|uniref:sulfotransferase n=1 Tax=Thalassococcus sp. S3 TaxID=2017482 RepID=UPI001023FC6C|nr:sulfotransferase [Thalassococcus sp. S3]QBF30550.1 hypothetical protein CFI11_04895 [Thalassococcus sp. S3]
MTVAALLAGLLAFVVMLRVLRAQQVASGVLDTARGAMAVMSDRHISDEEKERRMRRASVQMFRSFAVILGIGIVSLAVPSGIVWAGAALGLYALDHALAVALGWPFILASAGLAIAIWYLLERQRKASEAVVSDDLPYSPLDQALHAYAFASPERHRMLGDMESRLFSRSIDLDQAARPVFVTSLPRAGTTMLLEALAAHRDLASATYRHMPFTMAPLLWGRFSGLFRKPAERAERAHGDGIEVGFDSPEAFEEMIWMTFWKEHYQGASIVPWSADRRDPEFEAFLRRHMAKIVQAKGGAASRYVSKNNANIARLPLLQDMFPNGHFVIPIRSPWSQINSLRRQHLRFLDLHRREPFSRTYMEGIGHLEFGATLKPIAFEGAYHDPAGAEDLSFWLHYWISAYEAILNTLPSGAVIVDHDRLSANPRPHLAMLADRIELTNPADLEDMAKQFKASRLSEPASGLPPALVRRAKDLHGHLKDLALSPEQEIGT